MVLGCVFDADDLARSRHVSGYAAPEGLPKLGQLRQHGDASDEVSLIGIDEPDGRPVGAERPREAFTRRRQQRVEIHLAREQRGEIDEQREARGHWVE